MDKITFDFKNRTAIVTGGAQGFGFDIAKRFLKSGAKVIIWDNDPKAIESAIKKINNSNLSSNVVDVSNYEEVEKNVIRTNEEFHNLMENRKKRAEQRIKQLKNQAIKDIKNASVKIAIESVEKLFKNSIDKSKLDKIYSASIEETKLALRKKSS